MTGWLSVAMLGAMGDDDPGAGLPHLTEEQEALVLRCTVPAVQELLRARRALLHQLRSDGWTLQQLATLMRTSRQRVHQLLASRDP